MNEVKTITTANHTYVILQSNEYTSYSKMGYPQEYGGWFYIQRDGEKLFRRNGEFVSLESVEKYIADNDEKSYMWD